MHLKSISVSAVVLLLVSCVSTPKSPKPAPEEPFKSIALSPQEAIEGFELPAGYRLEVVLSEPQVAEPNLAVFDGNGRMYVAEMRTYMLDADGTGEFEPTSRVSMHEDTDGDGEMDRHTVFADNLLLPRIVLPLDDRIIIGETNTTCTPIGIQMAMESRMRRSCGTKAGRVAAISNTSPVD